MTLGQRFQSDFGNQTAQSQEKLVTLEASKKRSAEDLKGVQSQLETLNKRKETTEESALKNKKEIGRFKTMVTESEKELKDLKSKLLEREESSRQNKQLKHSLLFALFELASSKLLLVQGKRRAAH